MEAIEEEIRQTDLAIKNETSESIKLELIKGRTALYQGRNLLIQERLQQKGNLLSRTGVLHND